MAQHLKQNQLSFFYSPLIWQSRERSFNIRRLPIIDEAQTWEAKQTFSAGLSGELSGNAATATKLKTARKINNVSFDGTSDINLTPKNIGAFASGKQETPLRMIKPLDGTGVAEPITQLLVGHQR